MSDIGTQIAAAARGWVGTPFCWEASLKGVGADCRGLVVGAARECGRPEADEIEARLVGYSRRVDGAALEVGLSRLLDRVEGSVLPGDVIGFMIQRRFQHLAIATAPGRMVHAYSGRPAVVVEVPLGTFWQNRIAGVWRWREVQNVG